MRTLNFYWLTRKGHSELNSAVPYRGDRPLSKNEDDDWIDITIWQLAKERKKALASNAYNSIHTSLGRLNTAQIRVRIDDQDTRISRLVEMAYRSENVSVHDHYELVSRCSSISFQVHESVAELYGLYAWSSICDAALFDLSDLRSWLACFYSTHSKPLGLPVASLHKYSGSKCSLREFRRKLKMALINLQSETIHEKLRIANFDCAEDTLTVVKTGWKSTSANSKL